MGSENFSFTITAVTIQRQVGGSMASLFEMVAETVRNRQQFARKIRSLTAMGRMSAYTLAGIPFFIAGGITLTNPSYMRSAVPHAHRTHDAVHRPRDDGDRVLDPQENRLVQGVTEC